MTDQDARPSRETCDAWRAIYPDRPPCQASHYGDPQDPENVTHFDPPIDPLAGVNQDQSGHNP
jgi:hypothetical protein